MKFILIVSLCFTLLACSTTTVHLYSRYLSKDEISAVKSKLTDLGFKVEINTLAFPDEVKQSSLIYSPFIENEQRLSTVVDSVSALGWQLSNTQMLKEGNHWYTKNNVGLFLVPEGARARDNIAISDLVNEYKTRNCTTSAAIRLNNNGSYKISFSQSLSNSRVNRTDFNRGHWKITAFPYVELKSLNKKWFFYFKIEEIVDNIGTVNLIELVPENNYPVLPNCSFAFGLRA